MTRIEELNGIIGELDEQLKTLLRPLIEEIAVLEDQIAYYRSLPQIRIHPDDPSRQKPTAAAKLRKEASQSYMNAMRIILGVLNKAEPDAAEELMKRLEQFK